MSRSEGLASELHDQISALWIIDSHEHLPPEHVRLGMSVDLPSYFTHYPRFDLLAAGMPVEDVDRLQDTSLALDTRWNLLAPYYQATQHTTLSRSLRLGIQAKYGYEEITDSNYVAISEAMAEANRPGLYQQVFRDRARVLAALNQTSYEHWLPPPGSFRIAQIWERFVVPMGGQWAGDAFDPELATASSSLDDFVDAMGPVLARYRDAGAVGIKLRKHYVGAEPNKAEVEPLFRRAAGSGPFPQRFARLEEPECWLVRDYLVHKMIRAAGGLGLTILYHCGTLGTGRDYRVTDPTPMVPIFQANPEVAFELYHAGHPWVQDAAVIARGFPNVYLNLCWAPSLSKRLCVTALDLFLDMVPANKLMGFGGDTDRWPEWSLGELALTREVISEVLARRIDESLMTESQAMNEMKLALIQMESAVGEIEANVRRGVEFLDRACSQGADLVVLPEFWSTGYFLLSVNYDHYDLAASDDGCAMAAVKAMAKKHGAHVISTIYEEEGPGLYYNSSIIVDPGGAIVSKYRKVQVPARRGLEKLYYRGGSKFPVVQIGDWKVGVILCYDNLFPEPARCLALNGAELIAVPFGASTTEGAIWDKLMITRAFENGAFVAPCNSVGSLSMPDGDTFQLGGQSLVVNPAGEIIAQAGVTEETIVYAEIDRAEVYDARRKYFMFRDRRPDAYGAITAATEDLG